MATFEKYDDLFEFDGDLFEDPFNEGKFISAVFKKKNDVMVSNVPHNI